MKRNQGKTSSSNTEVKNPITLSTEAGHCASLSHLAFRSCAHLGRKHKVSCEACIPHYDPLSSSITQCSIGHLIMQLLSLSPSPHSRHSSRARAHGYKEIFNYTGAPTWGFSPTLTRWNQLPISLPIMAPYWSFDTWTDFSMTLPGSKLKMTCF